MDKIEEMRQWVAQLNEAADAYYGGRGEKMTDFEWDALFDRVRRREEETGVVLPDSPTQRVSADDVAGQKEPHEFAALSLAKTKRVEDVAKWAGGRAVWLSWKLDGLTLVATYDGGRLTKVVTRGDGHVGTNITHLAPGIRGIPQTVPYSGHLVVRGEAVISYADFEAFCATAVEDYANPRNLASGSLTLKSVDELRTRRLQWIPFTLVFGEKAPMSWGERLDALDALGFQTVARERLDVPDSASLGTAIDRWTRKVTARENPFPVDGLVVCYDDTAYARTGSVTGHHATRAGFAFKWRDEVAETELDHVEWSGAVGSLCPVAVFRPVSLEGTEVRRASLCNVSECERLGIGGPGSILSVIKANKIIPKVVGVVRKAGEFVWPTACPVCGAPTEIAVSANGTKTLRCTNAACPARELAKYERFVSDGGMDIAGLGGETIRVFVNQGWIRSCADIYRLSAHRSEMERLEGFGTKKVENVFRAIEASRKVKAVNFLVALAIPLCGPDVAKRLLREMDVKELFAKACGTPDLGAFADVDGIGPQKSAAFVEWCRDPEHRRLLDSLFREVEILSPELVRADGRCAGLTIVVTGDLHRFANREELKAYVEAQGGRVAGSVSAKTSFLVNNDSGSASGKNRKAQALGVPILDEEAFIARFGFPDDMAGMSGGSVGSQGEFDI